MKSTLCILLLCLIFSCKKESLSTQDRLIGKWELRKSFSSWTGTKTYPSGNGNIFEFTKTSFSSYSNGQLDASGSYSIIKDTSMFGSIGDRIIYNGFTTGPDIFVTITGQRLNMSLQAVDGSGEEYERIH